MKNGMAWVLAVAMAGVWAVGAVGARGETEIGLLEEGVGTGERTANGVLRRGVAAGEWTHDWEAALAAAKEAGEGGAVFANFTGSDWCGWCKLMDRKVFSTEEWKEWAKGSGVQFAWVDFPQDKSLLPDGETAKRNEELSEKYGVEGFPTYFLLDGEGEVIWQGGASREATPEGFIAELEGAREAARLGLAWRDAAAGLDFPKELGGLEYKGRTDYGTPELGYSLRYGDGRKEWVDVYVYEGDGEGIGEGASDGAKGEVEETLGIQLGRERRGEVGYVRLPEAGSVVKIGGVKYFAAGFQFAMGGGLQKAALDSTVAVTGRGTVFVKVRYSRLSEEGFMDVKAGMTETMKAVLRDLGRVLGGGGGPGRAAVKSEE